MDERIMGIISFENVFQCLVDVVPQLKSSYEREINSWAIEGEPGAHVILGSVLMPVLIPLLESEENEELLHRIFQFLEELANHKDVRVREVVAVTVCERLIDEARWIQRGRKYMGPTTLQVSQEIEAAWIDLPTRYGTGRG